tara:strand:- start:770 stop:1438 length:669 start_codon:yes stop_codon:yes gene_type:complete
MSIVSLFFRESPYLGEGDNKLVFDAVLEDRFSASVEYTRFPIEIGALATDHGIIQPRLWSLKGTVSNNPLTLELTDFAGGFLSNFFDSGVIATVGGFSAGFLSGSDNTRASAALTTLLNIMVARIPFAVNAGDITLDNMVIADLFRNKTPENENGLEFEAVLMELPTLATVITNQEPKASQLPDNDPAKTQASSIIERGELLGREIGETINSTIQETFGLSS